MKILNRGLWQMLLPAAVLILVLSGPVAAQSYTISGRVTDS